MYVFEPRRTLVVVEEVSRRALMSSLMCLAYCYVYLNCGSPDGLITD